MILNIMSDLFSMSILIGLVWAGMEVLDVIEVISLDWIRRRG